MPSSHKLQLFSSEPVCLATLVVFQLRSRGDETKSHCALALHLSPFFVNQRTDFPSGNNVCLAENVSGFSATWGREGKKEAGREKETLSFFFDQHISSHFPL